MVLGRGMEPHKLGLRLLLFVVVAVGSVLAVHSFFSYRSTRARLLGILDRNAEQNSRLIARSTHDAMLLNRLDEVQDTFERLVDGQELAAIRLYDKRGRIALSAISEEIGQRLDIGSETCASCHGPAPTLETALLFRDGMTRTPDGAEALRHLRVIANESACAGSACHASVETQPILGVLDVELSTAAVQRVLDAERSRVISSSVLLMSVLGIGSALYLHRVVHRPVVQLMAGTRRISSGDLSARIDVHGDDELSELALSFNRMAQDLDNAERELTSWSQTLEQRVLDKSQELQRANAQVLQMDRMASLGKLAATVAHELNNPLTGMLNYTRLAQRELSDCELGETRRQEVDRYLRYLQDECVRCGRIVQNLLVFARPHGEQMRPVDLYDVIERSLMLVQHQLHVGGVQLEWERGREGSTIVADGGQLQQALVALLINAVEAMGEKSPQERQLRLRLRDDSKGVILEVEDTGVGIAADAMPRIFEPFFSTKDEQSGVGLGLAVTYGIVRRHGGRIEVESKLGSGTCFRVHLPRDCSPEGAVAAASVDDPVPKGAPS